MTDNEIIRALECYNLQKNGDCPECPLRYSGDWWVCSEIILKNALDLINRQKAEIARLQTDVAPVRHGHIIWKRRRRGGFRHVKCLHRFCNFVIEDNAPCKHIAKIDERYTIDEPYCSECGKLLGDFLNYCGNCGAKMGGDENG